MHGSFFKSLYNTLSVIGPRDRKNLFQFDLTRDQQQEACLKHDKEARYKVVLFKFMGHRELFRSLLKDEAAEDCAWPELFYRKLVLCFLGVILATFLVKVF